MSTTSQTRRINTLHDCESLRPCRTVEEPLLSRKSTLEDPMLDTASTVCALGFDVNGTLTRPVSLLHHTRGYNNLEKALSSTRPLHPHPKDVPDTFFADVSALSSYILANDLKPNSMISILSKSDSMVPMNGVRGSDPVIQSIVIANELKNKHGEVGRFMQIQNNTSLLPPSTTKLTNSLFCSFVRDKHPTYFSDAESSYDRRLIAHVISQN